MKYITLLANTQLTWAGQVVPAGQEFSVPETVYESLVARGFATVVGEIPVEQDWEDADFVEKSDDLTTDTGANRAKELEKLTADELRDLAEEKGLDVSHLKRKAQIVDAILDAEATE